VTTAGAAGSSLRKQARLQIKRELSGERNRGGGKGKELKEARAVAPDYLILQVLTTLSALDN